MSSIWKRRQIRTSDKNWFTITYSPPNRKVLIISSGVKSLTVLIPCYHCRTPDCASCQTVPCPGQECVSTCWLTLITDPPAKTRRWPRVVLMLAHRLRRWANFKTTLGQCLMFDGPLPHAHAASNQAITHIPANMARSLNVGLLLGQRRRRWTNNEPALGQCLVLTGMHHQQMIWPNWSNAT